MRRDVHHRTDKAWATRPGRCGPLLLLVLLPAAAGCTVAPTGSPYERWLEGTPPSWSLEGGGSVHADATLEAQLPGPDVPELPARAGPEDYVRIALQNNPALRSARHRVERLLETVPQARSLDDPLLSVAPVGEMAETAAGQVGWMSSISQKLPFPGKLGTRGRIAAQEVAMAAQDLETTRLRVIADTRRAYWSHYYTTRAIEVIQEDRDLLSQFQQIAEAKYRTGTATQQDVLRASVELSGLDNELVTLRQQRTTAVAMLNSLLDRPITALLPDPPEVTPERISVRLEELLDGAAGTNPSLQKIHERIQESRERVRLAQLQRWPDLTLGFTYNGVQDRGIAASADGTDQWWVTFGINLPLWFNRLRAAEREAVKGLEEGVSDLTAEQNRVAFRVQDAFARVDTQQRLVLLFRDVIVPQTQQTVDASESGYEVGSLDFLTLVESWRKLLDARLMLHRSMAELEKDFADLQEEVGCDLERSARKASDG